MIDLITDNLPELTRLCRDFGVRKLEVFGSAATGDFDPATSDIEFLVEFDGHAASGFDNLFGVSGRRRQALWPGSRRGD